MATDTWPREAVINALREFKNHPQLYDPKHHLYTIKEERHSCYNRMTQNMQQVRPGTTVQELKIKLTNLRSQYVHVLTKWRLQNAEQNTDAKPSVWWYPYLMFMEPFIKPRNRSSGHLNGDYNNKMKIFKQIVDLSQEGGYSTPSAPKLQRLENFEVKIDDEHLKDHVFDNTNIVLEDVTIDMSGSDNIQLVVEGKSSPDGQQDEFFKKSYKVLEKLDNSLASCEQKHNLSAFVNFVMDEMESIKDQELVADMKHEIINVLFAAKKKYLKRVS